MNTLIREMLRIDAVSDAELNAVIGAARADMIRSGVPAYVAEGGSNLVTMCILTYCNIHFEDDLQKREGFMRSYQCQLDAIRKSKTWQEG